MNHASLRSHVCVTPSYTDFGIDLVTCFDQGDTHRGLTSTFSLGIAPRDTPLGSQPPCCREAQARIPDNEATRPGNPEKRLSWTFRFQPLPSQCSHVRDIGYSTGHRRTTGRAYSTHEIVRNWRFLLGSNRKQT